MITPFEKLSDSARIWIYQSDRPFTPEELKLIEEKAGAFITSWAAHGQDLLASTTVLHNLFLIVSADEDFNMASGCSIDSQFRFVQQLGTELKIDFFNRMNIAFLKGEGVAIIPMSQLKQEVEKGNIQPDSTFFDNNIQTKEQLDNAWLKLAADSWLSRYLKTQKNVV